MPLLNQQLDPDFAAVVAGFGVASLDDATVRALRSTPAPPGVTPDSVERVDRRVPGTPPVPVRVHRPRDASGPLPAVVSMHGGGLVIGTLDLDDPLFDDWCPSLGVIGISVGYRLAPEDPYPAALDDCYAVWQWTRANAADLGIDAARLGIRGVSAGGCLAAALTLLLRQRGEEQPAFQLLDSPMLDDRQRTPSSRQDDLAVWSRASNSYAWRAYLGDRVGGDDVPATAAPARANDLAGLPTAFLSVGGVDGFRDEGVDYATRLNQAGVACELHVYPGAPHGYHRFPDARVSRQSRADMARWLEAQTASEI